MSTGNQGLDALVDAIAERMLARLRVSQSQDEPRIQPALMTVEQAAEYMAVSPASIRTQMSRGQLPFVKRGRRKFLSRKKLDELIAEGEDRHYE